MENVCISVIVQRFSVVLLQDGFYLSGKIEKQSRDHNHAFLLVIYTDRHTQTDRHTMMAITRAELCSGNSHHRVSVCLCVCVSHAGIVSKRLNVGARKQHHVIAQGI